MPEKVPGVVEWHMQFNDQWVSPIEKEYIATRPTDRLRHI